MITTTSCGLRRLIIAGLLCAFPGVAFAQGDPLQETGPLQEVAEGMGKLLVFSLKGDHLSLDREHWKKSFGGKTIAALEEEIQEEVRKRGLPKNWYRLQFFYSQAARVAPHALFARVFEKIGGYSRSTNGQGWDSSLRMTAHNKLTGELILQSKGRKQPVFSVNFQETAGPERTLNVVDEGDGLLVITLTSDASDYLLRLTQRPGGPCRLQRLRGAEVLNVKAPTFRELLSRHAAIINKEFVPVMKHVGVNVEVAKKK